MSIDSGVQIKAPVRWMLRYLASNRVFAGAIALRMKDELLAEAALRKSWNGLRSGLTPSVQQRLFSVLVEYGDRSQSQLGQDLFALASKSQPLGGGFFVEFGATDGISLSNTYLLEKEFGWSGLLAEPNPEWHARLEKNRTAKISRDCISSRSGERVEFVQTEQPELATMADFVDCDHYAALRAGREKISVETISLLDFLEVHQAPRHIDYLSVDTEGSEFEILNAFDFSRYTIGAITVEHNFTATREKVFGLLSAHGYRRVLTGLSKWDDWYLGPEAGQDDQL